jgi:hypothetical protein
MLLAIGGAAAQTDLDQQYQFESKLWPNLHHFLYVLARARNGAPDRNRVAVRNAPLDLEGFDALPVDRRKIWDDAVEAYRIHTAPLDIGYGPLVDVNYAVADLPAGAPIEGTREIPTELREALSKAAPIYRDVWWPRHDAANQKWLRELRPLIERYGAKIVPQLVSAFQHPWPTGKLRVEIVAYANFGGAYTTEDPPLIAMSSLDPEQQGADALEELLHECSHLMMGTVEAAGKGFSRDVTHTILFYTVGEVLRRTVPDHVPYAIDYGVWQRGWTKNFDVLKLEWQPYLDGKATMNEALDKIVRSLASQ